MESRSKPGAFEIVAAAYEAHKRIEEKFKKGQTEMFKDERFVQFMLYEVFCEKFEINDPLHEGRVVLEYQAPCLQHFKPPKSRGSPLTIDFAINPEASIYPDREDFPIGIEMKLAKSYYTDRNKMASIQSDLVRLSYMMQCGFTNHCYFFMFGLFDELESIHIPGLPRNEQRCPESSQCFSFCITQRFYETNLYKRFCQPQRSNLHDIANELCLKPIVDSTNQDFCVRNLKRCRFETGVKVWSVCKPNPKPCGYIQCPDTFVPCACD